MKKANKSGKSCRKVGYHTKKASKLALKIFGRDRGSIRSYKCPHHREEMWHLTSHKS